MGKVRSLLNFLILILQVSIIIKLHKGTFSFLVLREIKSLACAWEVMRFKCRRKGERKLEGHRLSSRGGCGPLSVLTYWASWNLFLQ